MRWGVLEGRRGVVHIASLSREQTGLKCGCVCSGCGGRLQAVNAGRQQDYHSAPNFLGQFFRHDTGIQREGCLSAAARMAALELLVNHDELDLPAPAVQSTHNGLYGDAYTADAIGKPYRARIVSRHWIDDQAATLTLDDGRTVLVHMRTISGFGAGTDWDAVVSIRVSDPDVASWPPEQILQQIRLHPGFTCWERHWHLDELRRKADAAAAQLATQAGDVMPADLMYEGELPPASEGVLHWVVKKLLVAAGRIRVPGLSHRVEDAHDSQSFSRVATVPATLLELRDVRVEHRLPGLVPDIVCMARNTSGKSEEFELLVEVAVTHKVNEEKLQKIRAQGLACLELDATKFKVGGRVRVGELSLEVVTDTRNKRWLHHPQLDIEISKAKAALKQEIRQAQLAQQEQVDRANWLSSHPADELREHYLLAMELPPGVLTVDGREWDVTDFARGLAEKNWASATDEIFAGKNSMVRCIASIKARARGSRIDMAQVFEQFDGYLQQSPYQSFATLVCIAFKVYFPPLTTSQRSRLDRANEHIKETLKANQRTFARPTKHDRFIAFLFPEMADSLVKAFGTREKVDQDLRQEWLRELERQNKQRATEFLQEQERQKREEQAALDGQITAACRCNWAKPFGFTRDAEQILSRRDVKQVVRLNGKYLTDASSLIRSACQARVDGVTLETWFRANCAADAMAVAALDRLLRAAWLVLNETPQARR
jgi:hypothetical protein